MQWSSNGGGSVASHEDGHSARSRSDDELETQVGFLEAEVVGPAAPAVRRPAGHPVPRATTRRDPVLTGVADLPERAPRGDAARGPRPDHDAEGGGRPAGAAADRLRHLPRQSNDDDTIDVFTGGRKLRVNVSPNVDVEELERGQEVMLNEALNVVAALDFEQVGEVVMLKEILADGDRALVIANADEERVVRIAAAAARREAARRRLGAARRPRRLHLRAHPEDRGRGARPRRGPGHRLHEHRRPDPADRPDPRRDRAAVPAPGAVPRARAEAAEGRAALRPAGVRQDPDRQGGRELAGQEGRRQDR